MRHSAYPDRLPPGDRGRGLRLLDRVPGGRPRLPSSSQAWRPSRTPTPVRYLRTSSFDQSSRKSRRTSRRLVRLNRSASSAARGASSAAVCLMARARAQVAAIANSSAPMSTTRPRKACLCSSRRPVASMPWKIERASWRDERSTKRRWRGERAELAVRAGSAPCRASGRVATWRRTRRHAREGLEPWRRRRRPGRCRSPATSQVLVDRLAGDEQVHDLGRALEDPVDPQSRSSCSTGHRPLAAGRQRRRRLVAAAAADLQQFVGDPPGPSRWSTAWRRRLDPDVVASPRRPSRWPGRASTPGRRRSRRCTAILCATASCLPTGRPHCTRSADHSRHDLEAPLAARRRTSPAARAGRC